MNHVTVNSPWALDRPEWTDAVVAWDAMLSEAVGAPTEEPSATVDEAVAAIAAPTLLFDLVVTAGDEHALAMRWSGTDRALFAADVTATTLVIEQVTPDWLGDAVAEQAAGSWCASRRREELDDVVVLWRWTRCRGDARVRSAGDVIVAGTEGPGAIRTALVEALAAIDTQPDDPAHAWRPLDGDAASIGASLGEDHPLVEVAAGLDVDVRLTFDDVDLLIAGGTTGTMLIRDEADVPGPPLARVSESDVMSEVVQFVEAVLPGIAPAVPEAVVATIEDWSARPEIVAAPEPHRFEWVVGPADGDEHLQRGVALVVGDEAWLLVPEWPAEPPEGGRGYLAADRMFVSLVGRAELIAYVGRAYAVELERQAAATAQPTA